MKNNSLRNVFKSYILLTFDTAIFYKYFFFTLYRLSKIYKCCCCFHFYGIVLTLLLPFQNSMVGKIPFVCSGAGVSFPRDGATQKKKNREKERNKR